MTYEPPTVDNAPYPDGTVAGLMDMMRPGKIETRYILCHSHNKGLQFPTVLLNTPYSDHCHHLPIVLTAASKDLPDKLDEHMDALTNWVDMWVGKFMSDRVHEADTLTDFERELLCQRITEGKNPMTEIFDIIDSRVPPLTMHTLAEMLATAIGKELGVEVVPHVIPADADLSEDGITKLLQDIKAGGPTDATPTED